jgi:hypothetical protein
VITAYVEYLKPTTEWSIVSRRKDSERSIFAVKGTKAGAIADPCL